MFNSFRQGIIRYPSANGVQAFLTRVGNTINLNVSEANRLDYTIAHMSSDYKFSETRPIIGAWTNLTGAPTWLYVDINRYSAIRTFGMTTVEPVYQHQAPVGVEGMLWYDTGRFKQYEFKGGKWQEVLRLLLAKVVGHDFISVSINSGNSFAGTQIGAIGNHETQVGRILIDERGYPIVKKSGEFVTTSTEIFSESSLVSQIRIEATVVNAFASTPIGEYQVIKWNDDGTVLPAKYADVSNVTIGITHNSAEVGAPVQISLQGVITNPAWSWTTSNTLLWVDNTGKLVDRDPNVIDAVNNPVAFPPVARSIDAHSIFFDQGLINRWANLNLSPVKSVNSVFPDYTGNVQLSVVPEAPVNGRYWVRHDAGWSELTSANFDVDFADIKQLPTTIDGYGITDAVRDTTTIVGNNPIDVSGSLAVGNVAINLKLDPKNTNLAKITTDGLLVESSIGESDSIKIENGTAELNLDPTVPNMIIVNSNGVSASVSHANTPTITLSGAGVAGNLLQGAVKISPSAINAIVVDANGLVVGVPIATNDYTVKPTATGSDSIAIGSSSKATHTNSIVLGNNLNSTKDNQLIIGTNANLKVISGVANPIDDTDAVNLRYLNTLSFVKTVKGEQGVVAVQTGSQVSVGLNLSTNANQALTVTNDQALVLNPALAWNGQLGRLTFTDCKGEVNNISLDGLGTDTVPTAMSIDAANILSLATSDPAAQPVTVDLSQLTESNIQSSNSITLGGNGSVAAPLTASIKVDSDVNNKLTISAAGVMVNAEIPTANTAGLVAISQANGKLGWSQLGQIGVVQSIQPGANITVDSSDPANPVISAEITGSTNADWAATSGPSLILNKPLLGTASAANVEQFATAAQGVKADTAVQPAELATVATSGSYTDLTNTPPNGIVVVESTNNLLTVDSTNAPANVKLTVNSANLPQSDWNASSGPSFILNKPVIGTAAGANVEQFATAAQGTKADTAVQPAQLATVATTGNYADLTGLPLPAGSSIVSTIQPGTNITVDDTDPANPIISTTIDSGIQEIIPGSGIAVVPDATGKILTVSSTLTKADIGLGNVNNTSDLNKPVSTATQAALDALVIDDGTY